MNISRSYNALYSVCCNLSLLRQEYSYPDVGRQFRLILIAKIQISESLDEKR